MQGFLGVQGPSGNRGVIYEMSVGLNNYSGLTLPFSPTKSGISTVTDSDNRVIGSAIYLNQPSSYYVINMSPQSLGDSYIANPNNGIGAWNITTIYAGVNMGVGPPAEYFDLSRRPVTFYFQNVSGVPIQLNFGSNDSHYNVTYFSFGSPPYQTPSSYVVDPLGILVIETVFTSLNVVRFYNSFLDSLAPNRFYRILNRASKRGYFSPSQKVTGTLLSATLLSISSNYVFQVAEVSKSSAQAVITATAPLTLTLDGTEISPRAEVQILVIPTVPIQLQLVNLVNSRNYLGEKIPSVLFPGNQFIVVTGTRVVVYDAGVSDINTLPYTFPQQNFILGYTAQFDQCPPFYLAAPISSSGQPELPRGVIFDTNISRVTLPTGYYIITAPFAIFDNPTAQPAFTLDTTGTSILISETITLVDGIITIYISWGLAISEPGGVFTLINQTKDAEGNPYSEVSTILGEEVGNYVAVNQILPLGITSTSQFLSFIKSLQGV